MFGYHGRIITIDATDSSFQIETYDEIVSADATWEAEIG
jgi:hypothetical protein